MASRPSAQARIAAAREQRRVAGRIRVRRSVELREGVRCQVRDAGGAARWLLNFCSNDYLGLAQAPAVVAALQEATAREGAGATASHLVCGHHAAHAALERALADWLEVPAALLFGSGYLANLAVLQALLGAGDVCVQDRLNHASLIDGARLAGCRLRRYPHADAEAALRQLRGQPDGAAMLATDGVFSMDGDIAPLPELARVARGEQALLYVDDAHGIGVLGPQGRGSVAAAGLGVDAAPLQLVTLGKALGGHGAVVAGDADLVRHLAETARPYLYTTASPPAQASAALQAVQLARADDWRRQRLGEAIARLRAGAGRDGFDLLPSQTPIQPLPCGDDATTMAMAAALEDAGIWVAAIRPPTVPEGQARLRITLSALHSDADIDALLEALCRARDVVAAREPAHA